MPVPILTDLVIIFGLSIGVLFICHQLRVPVTQVLPNPEPDMQLLPDDLLIVMGTPENLSQAAWLFKNSEIRP